jgi:transposase
MASSPTIVTAGVDTHGQTHHAAVIDQAGRHLNDAEFPTTLAGYRALLHWLTGHGEVDRVGVEGTGTYGVGLTRVLREHGLVVVEVDRPDRKLRRSRGKSDPVDAYAAALAALSGRASSTPKLRNGRVEAIRALRVVRRSAVKARTQAINQLKALVVSAPDELRERLRDLSTTLLVRTCAALRPSGPMSDPATATKLALKTLARRSRELTEEVRSLDIELSALIGEASPELLERVGVGTEVAGALLVTAGDNPDRLHSEPAFANLCAAAPVQASSGRTDRHRLNRGGDRSANQALYTIVLSRMRHDPRTRAYVAKAPSSRAVHQRHHPLPETVRRKGDLPPASPTDRSAEGRQPPTHHA